MHEANISATQYFLGIDGGGSKTLAVIVNASGEECGRGLASSSNYAVVGIPLAIQAIFEAAQKATEQAGLTLPVSRAWLGLAGIDRPDDHAKLQPHLKELAEIVHITNDAALGLSTLKNNVGVIVVAGTGSIALGRNAQGRIERCGGWGHILDDEGSGYEIARQALRAAVRAADGRGKPTLLLALLLKYWGLERAEELLGQVYGNTNNKATIARLSTCVFQAEQQHDPIAVQIVQNAAQELALLIITVAARLELININDPADRRAPQHLPLALSGGLLVNEERYRELVLEDLRRQHIYPDAVMVQQPALSAARGIMQLQTVEA